MTRLEEVRELRVEAYNDYLVNANKIWNDEELTLEEKDKKNKKNYTKYRNRESILGQLEINEQAQIENLEYYKTKMR